MFIKSSRGLLKLVQDVAADAEVIHLVGLDVAALCHCIALSHGNHREQWKWSRGQQTDEAGDAGKLGVGVVVALHNDLLHDLDVQLCAAIQESE